MTKLSAVLTNRLIEGKWEKLRTSGKHPVWEYPPNGETFTVPTTIRDVANKRSNYLADIQRLENKNREIPLPGISIKIVSSKPKVASLKPIPKVKAVPAEVPMNTLSEVPMNTLSQTPNNPTETPTRTVPVLAPDDAPWYVWIKSARVAGEINRSDLARHIGQMKHEVPFAEYSMAGIEAGTRKFSLSEFNEWLDFVKVTPPMPIPLCEGNELIERVKMSERRSVTPAASIATFLKHLGPLFPNEQNFLAQQVMAAYEAKQDGHWANPELREALDLLNTNPKGLNPKSLGTILSKRRDQNYDGLVLKGNGGGKQGMVYRIIRISDTILPALDTPAVVPPVVVIPKTEVIEDQGKYSLVQKLFSRYAELNTIIKSAEAEQIELRTLIDGLRKLFPEDFMNFINKDISC
jgi:hypothetical protein